MRVKNFRPNATNVRGFGSWDAGEEREVSEEAGRELIAMAGFGMVEDIPTPKPKKAKKQKAKKSAKGG